MTTCFLNVYISINIIIYFTSYVFIFCERPNLFIYVLFGGTLYDVVTYVCKDILPLRILALSTEVFREVLKKLIVCGYVLSIFNP